ncbi:unnamed protein product [Notodromas monacha]|uniref:DH domain-containing protein n=1 Tax=Notodromas monacha TaxID=399045 RepID=A0A7R9BNV7_9CRUS|nr:unnamed protein product [Notodromas monacha]CAG0918975.1 unnamed protein product [Notodromas monacha]
MNFGKISAVYCASSEVELEEIPSEGNTRQSLLKGLKALASLDACEKRRQECIAELINTEEAYVADMAIVKEVFEKPLRQNAVLTEYECHEIFVNWDELHHCNDKLLRALRVRKTRSNHGIISTVGDIMCENFPNMTQYIRYCACQLRACEILHRKKEENSEFEAVHRICVTDARSKGMPLSSFLLKPTQRITRYPLLLKNILKNTPIGHPDRLYLEEALEKAEELCSQVEFWFAIYPDFGWETSGQADIYFTHFA